MVEISFGRRREIVLLICPAKGLGFFSCYRVKFSPFWFARISYLTDISGVSLNKLLSRTAYILSQDMLSSVKHFAPNEPTHIWIFMRLKEIFHTESSRSKSSPLYYCLQAIRSSARVFSKLNLSCLSCFVAQLSTAPVFLWSGTRAPTLWRHALENLCSRSKMAILEPTWLT